RLCVRVVSRDAAKSASVFQSPTRTFASVHVSIPDVFNAAWDCRLTFPGVTGLPPVSAAESMASRRAIWWVAVRDREAADARSALIQFSQLRTSSSAALAGQDVQA